MDSLRSVPRNPLHDVLIAVLIAACVCAVRIGIFDYNHFLLAALPSHDSLSAAGMFQSSVHSMRIDGDIAWWLPSKQGGYPQYYNLFLSPLAPTAGNIPFLVWLTGIRILGWIHITIPEYFQFLIFELILMPVLAYTALCLMLRRFCSTWIAPMLGVICYALSGTGLWNNAWMFYQEWLNLFLLIFVLDLFLERPSFARIGLLAFAGLNLITSANYWTIFSQWFLYAFLISYVVCSWDKIRLAFVWLRHDFPWSNLLARLTIASFLLSIVAWVALLGLVHREQTSVLQRYADAPSYSIAQAFGRAQTGGVVRFTAALFDPELKAPATGYLAGNWMHAANYIGLGLLPLLVGFLFIRWSAIDVVLFTLLATSSLVTLASGVFIFLWQITPGMGSQLHAFYFYSYFVELSLILIGCRTLDRMLRDDNDTDNVIRIAPAITAGLGLICLAGVFTTYTATEPTAFDRWAYTGIFLILVSFALLKMIAAPRRIRSFLAALFLFMVLGDLGRYYWIATGNDQMFTLWFRKTTLENARLPAALVQKMRSTWPIPGETTKLDADIVDNMPVETSLWPDNTFNPSQAIRKFQALPAAQRAELTPSGSLDLADSERIENGVALAKPKRDASLLTYRISRWGYNESRIEFDAKAGGKLLIAQAFDPNWKFVVNGRSVTASNVNYWMTVVPVDAGLGVLTMTYSPLSRKIYKPAIYLLVLTLGLLFVFVKRGRRRTAFV